MSQVINELVECIKCKQIWYKGELSLNDKAIAILTSGDALDVIRKELRDLYCLELETLAFGMSKDDWTKLDFINHRQKEIEQWFESMGLNRHGEDQNYICPDCETKAVL